MSASNSELGTVSIVCGVKDEERLIEATLRSLLTLGAPVLEVIVVDDRSEDRTPAILAALAVEMPQLRVVRVDELPLGWQGRAHAHWCGARVARGDFILCTDAEIQVPLEALRAALGMARDRRLDHLAVLPEVFPKPFVLDLMLTTALVFYLASNRPWLAIEDRPLGSVRGVGVFNLVRRSFLERTPGFAGFRMEIIDDVALAQSVAAHGGRSLLVRASDAGPRFHWYRSVGEMVVRLEKSIVGAFSDYRVDKTIAVVALSMCGIVVPVLALVWSSSVVSLVAVGVFVVATALWSAAVGGALQRRFAVLFALPVGIALMGAVLLRASVLCHARGGILWKGVLYPLRELRARRQTSFRF